MELQIKQLQMLQIDQFGSSNLLKRNPWFWWIFFQDASKRGCIMRDKKLDAKLTSLIFPT